MGKLIHMPDRRQTLPRRPEQFAAGSDLEPGAYCVIAVNEAFTISRTIGALRWYPLTQRENPAWLTWPTWAAAQAQLDGSEPTICTHRFWGR